MENDLTNNLENNEQKTEGKNIKVCSKCGKIVEDLKKGCQSCNGNKDYITQDEYKKVEEINLPVNEVASIWEKISEYTLIFGITLVFILYLIFVFFDIDFEHPFLIFLIIIVCGALNYFISLTLSEVIQILHDIRIKLWKK